MNIISDSIDLALAKNQNELAIQLSTYFSVEELITIDLDNSSISLDNKVYTLYEKSFKNNKTISIVYVQLPEESSILQGTNNKFIYIRININNHQSDFKYRYSKMIIKYISLSIKTAINYSNFKNPKDKLVIKKNIISNAAMKLATKYDLDPLEELNYVIFDASSKEDVLTPGFEYCKELDYRTTAAIETMKYYIVFGIYDSILKKNPYLYFVDRSISGLSQLSVLSEESIVNKNKMKFE